MFNYFDIRNSLSGRFWALVLGPFFKKRGRRVRIVAPLKLKGLKNMQFGDHVIVNRLAWLQVEHPQGELKIGAGSVLGHMNHIYAFRQITLGEKVLTADKVYISDCVHDYSDIEIAVMDQQTIGLAPVHIGDHSWLGENVVILGASVGRHCIIGSNSVVTKDIPDYSIAVGSPAKVIKSYNHHSQQWEAVKGKSNQD